MRGRRQRRAGRVAETRTYRCVAEGRRPDKEHVCLAPGSEQGACSCGAWFELVNVEKHLTSVSVL